MMIDATTDPTVLHASPGRIRIHRPNWSGNAPQVLASRLREMCGVRRAKANPWTRNVLIVFDERTVEIDTLLETLRQAEQEADGAPEEAPSPPVILENLFGRVQRGWIAVRGLEHAGHLARNIVARLESHAGVRVRPVPLTGHVQVEFDSEKIPLSDLAAEIAEEVPAALPGEALPDHPLDPAPLVQAIARTGGALAGLGWIAARRLLGHTAPPRGFKVAATTAAVVGLLRSFPAFRHGMRRVLGRHTADAVVSVVGVVSLTTANSPLGLAVLGAEGYVLLRQVLAQRGAWNRYEDHNDHSLEARPGEARRLEADDRTPFGARVLEGTGTALGQDGLPVPVRPSQRVPAGARLAGGPFLLEFEEQSDFCPLPRPAPPVSPIGDWYLQMLGPASFLYAGMVGVTSGSWLRTFNALLTVNPRTALGGTEAANLDAATRVTRAGVIVVGTRPERAIQRPDLLLLDGARMLCDGLELDDVTALDESEDDAKLVALAGAVAAAAGSPWGKVFPQVEMPEVSEGSFDGRRASARIDGQHYQLGPRDDDSPGAEAAGWRHRGQYVLELHCGDRHRPLALLTLRPRLAGGVTELVETCRRFGVQLGLLPRGDPEVVRAVSHRAEIPLTVSSDALALIHRAQRQEAYVAVVSDSIEAAPAFADCDLAIGLAAGRIRFPARVDLLAADLSAIAAVIETGARHDAAVRDAILLSAASNVVGAVWSSTAKPGVEKASLPVYLGLLSAVTDVFVRLAGGWRPGTSVPQLIDPQPERWGRQSVEQVLRALDTIEQGLSDDTAAQRRKREPHQKERWELAYSFLDQFRCPTTSILAAAAGFSLIVGKTVDFGVITTTVGLNIAVGVWQEYQANRAAKVLKQMATARARLLRDGRQVLVSATEVVPGDVLLLEAGDRVAADARLLSVDGLEVDEAALTGESVPVFKSADQGPPESRIVLEGSDVVVGTGRAVVVATGQQTRMGTMAVALEVNGTDQSPLGARLGELLWHSLPWTVAASGIVVFSRWIRGGPLLSQLGVGASMALASVPEGLPLLAGMGQGGVARRLAQHHALVRRPGAVEALGRVDVACADKTGTMTEGRLGLHCISDGEQQARLADGLPESLSRILLTAALASPHPDAAGAAADSTDVAVVEGAFEAGLGEAFRGTRQEEDPFHPDQAFHATSAQGRFCVKGAVETLLPNCTRRRRGDREEPLDEAGRHALADHARHLADQGLRVLMVAEGDPDRPIDELDDLAALGFLGIRDPLRPTVPAAVRRCQEAGVRVIMITGDHPGTARSIAEEAGLPVHDESILLGSEIADLDQQQLQERMGRATVIARATPLDKLRIIQCLQGLGHAVAMTGDGVNDAPALRLADVGVAMGRIGTEVASQAADMILTDDDFATLVEALVEGRVFWQNMRSALGLLLGGNLGELGLMAGAAALGTPSPLTAVQILVVNLFSDAVPALAVVLQHPEHRHLAGLAREGLVAMDAALRKDILRRALATSIPALAGYWLARRSGGDEQAKTVAFATIVANQLAQTLDAGRHGQWPSHQVVGAVFASTGLLATTLAIRPLRRLLGLVVPTPHSLMLISGSVLAAGWMGHEREEEPEEPTSSVRSKQV
ncbi:MAG: HAD family hydrolase [Planctomycetaceae bacterium]|nr:MAG: HAD family hydrolase [Planctomycetaceae bacterium]